MAYDRTRYSRPENRGDREYADRYRVRSMIKSFRDLEVYQKTIQLSNEISLLSFLGETEKNELKIISEKIPQLIAESYGDKFESKEIAREKLTLCSTLIADIITKIDLLREKFQAQKEQKDSLDRILTKFQAQKRKILNFVHTYKN